MSSVSRSEYQKKLEENKRLLSAIYILTSEKYSLSPEKMNLVMEWRHKFIEDRRFRKLLQELAKLYLNEHPELRVYKKPSV